MSQGLCLTQSLDQSLTLTQFIGERSGDIPVYSLHRIRSHVASTPLPVNVQVQTMFLCEVIAANNVYREESGNDWYCLTSINLVTALEELEAKLRKINDLAIKSQSKDVRPVLQKVFSRARTKCIHDIRDWFDSNHDSLLYNMKGSIPWPIVQRLRRSLKAWSFGITDPFGQDIEDMVIEVAEEQGHHYNDAESAWKAMGGKILKKTKK
mgnify:CR=1 FL=1